MRRSASGRRSSVGGSVREHAAEARKKDPAFALAFDKLRLARRLKALRVERGLTQAEIGKAAKTTQSAIARFEDGEHVPSLELIQKVAHALGVRMRVELEQRPAR